MTSFSKISAVDNILDELKNTDDFDLSLITAVIQVAQSELAHLNKLNLQLLEAVKKEETNRARRANYANKQKRGNKRKHQANHDHCDEGPDGWEGHVGEDTEAKTKFSSWEAIRDSVSDRIFRRKFRMTKDQFQLLCSKIKTKIGDDDFRTTNTQAICGYTKVAIGLRLLCGGSYLDLVGRAYDVEATSTVYRYFHTFILSYFHRLGRQGIRLPMGRFDQAA